MHVRSCGLRGVLSFALGCGGSRGQNSDARPEVMALMVTQKRTLIIIQTMDKAHRMFMIGFHRQMAARPFEDQAGLLNLAILASHKEH